MILRTQLSTGVQRTALQQAARSVHSHNIDDITLHATLAATSPNDLGRHITQRPWPPHHPTRRRFARSMRAAAIASPSVDLCSSVNIDSSSANTRSHEAEFGEIAKATRAACAQPQSHHLLPFRDLAFREIFGGRRG